MKFLLHTSQGRNKQKIFTNILINQYNPFVSTFCGKKLVKLHTILQNHVIQEMDDRVIFIDSWKNLKYVEKNLCIRKIKHI